MVTERVKQRTFHLDVVLMNTHVGRGLERPPNEPKSGLQKVVEPSDDILLLQEVTTPEARRRLRNQFGHPAWWVFGVPNYSKGRVGTFICVRRKAWHSPAVTNKLISHKIDRPPNVDMPNLWPQRNLTGVHITHRLSSVPFRITSAHPWYVGKDWGWDSKHPAMRGHKKQVDAYAEYHRDSRPGKVVDLSGGDWNEWLKDRDCYARRTMREKARMRPAFSITQRGDREVRIDDLFVNNLVVVRNRNVFELPERFGLDHPVTRVRIAFEGNA